MVFVNGTEAGSHKGGYVSFALEISSLLKEGETILWFYARDDTRSPMQPIGKQSDRYYSYSLFLYPYHRHLADRMAGIHPSPISQRTVIIPIPLMVPLPSKLWWKGKAPSAHLLFMKGPNAEAPWRKRFPGM